MTAPTPQRGGDTSARIRALPGPGAELGPFTVVGPLGRGAMGLVLHVRDHSGRDLALKLLTRDASAQALQRFQREGQVTAALHHPGIVAVHGAGVVQGWPYIAYELIPGGRTLEDVLTLGDRERSLGLVLQVAEALGHAHAQGVVHRDLKPANVLVDDAGRARVADFGLAQVVGLERLTATGALVGTPCSMAPEQVAGKREDYGPPTDVWALGTLLYRALTGEDPFRGGTLTELAARIAAAEPRPPRSLVPETSPGLEAVCLQALRKAPSERYPDANAFADDLRRALAGQAPAAAASARRPARAPLFLGAAAGILLLVTAAWLALRSPHPRTPVTQPAPPQDPASLAAEREARREAKREARLVAQLEDALQTISSHPDQAETELGHFDVSALRASPTCVARLTGSQVQLAGRVRQTLAAETPPPKPLLAQLEALAAVSEALPPDAPRFPESSATANRLIELGQSEQFTDVVTLPYLEALARTGARVTDERLASQYLTLTGIGLKSRFTVAQGRRIFLVFARLDIGFKNGIQLEGGIAGRPYTPIGSGPWERYVRLRLNASPGEGGRLVREELRRLLRDPPPGLDLGPVHRSEACYLASLDLPSRERLQLLDEALRLDPGFIACLRLRALTLSELGRPEEALAACTQTETCFRDKLYGQAPGTSAAQAVAWLRVAVLAAAGDRTGALATARQARTRFAAPPALIERYPWLEQESGR